MLAQLSHWILIATLSQAPHGDGLVESDPGRCGRGDPHARSRSNAG